MEGERHWQSVYARLRPNETSWYQDEARMSRTLVERAGLSQDDPIIDVGGGASPLARDLLEAGYTNVSVLDISSGAIAAGRERLGDRADHVSWIEADLFDVDLPVAHYALWHDRAFFHFLTESEQRARYRARLEGALRADGYVILATFAADGPQQCSGLNVARYAADELAAELTPGFRLVAAKREEHQTPRGGVQPFTYGLFQRM